MAADDTIEPEIDLVRMPAEEWRTLLRTAAELDLVHGGYYRPRPGEIWCYAGPDNAPPEWKGAFTDGSPDLPRALCGTLTAVNAPALVDLETAGEERVREVVVRLQVSNWAAAQAVKKAYDGGEYRGRFQEFILAQESALRGRREDRDWLRTQFRRLRSHAQGSLVGDA